MVNLKRACRELFRRVPDETFDSLEQLHEHCRRQQQQSLDRWHQPQMLRPAENANSNLLRLEIGDDGAFEMNDWSFSQLCRLAGVNKDTVNRLSPATAGQVFRETLPSGKKPLQILTEGDRIRSIHGTQYTRLWNEYLLRTIMEHATGFQPPHKGFNGGTGLYAGEQDLFCFLIDPAGWVEINQETFAPGFFVWNSEVGKRSLGVQTFWFQAICANHIVWDATEVIEWTRKHTGNVQDGLTNIREIIVDLVRKRDERKDGFTAAIRKAMRERLGDDADECLAQLTRRGIARAAAKQAIEQAQKRGGFSIWNLVDALTRLAREENYVGLRTEAEFKASQLLQLAV